jgi:adenosylhomocysteine nucleosidase
MAGGAGEDEHGSRGVRAEASGATAIVSPLAAELAVVAAAATGLRRLRLGGGWAARGWLGGWPVVLATTGDGALAAARGLERLLAAERPERLLVLGVAGGISPGLATGDLVVARRIFEWRVEGGEAGELVEVPEGRVDGMVMGGSSAGRLAAGAAISCDRILVESREKLALYERLRRLGPAGTDGMTAVCDLESAVYARLAAAHGIPFLVVRAVLDPAEEDLPLDFNRCRTAGGEVSNARVVTRALAQGFGPGGAGRAGFAALLRLRARLRLCARRLGAIALELAGGAAGLAPAAAATRVGGRVNG